MASFLKQVKKLRANALRRASSQATPPGVDGFARKAASADPARPSAPPRASAPSGLDLSAPGTGLSAIEQARVLENAAMMFARGGHRKVTVDDIATYAGVNRASLLTTFKSRDELLFRAATWQVDEFLKLGHSWVDPKTDARLLLRSVSERAFEYIGHHPLAMQLMLGVLAEAAPAYEQKMQHLRERFVSVLVDVLSIGITQGVFRPMEDLPVRALLLLDLHVAGYLLHQRDAIEKNAMVEKRRSVALDLVMNGIAAR